MKGSGLVISLIFALLAFAVGFVGVAAALNVTQPAVKGSAVVVQFEIKSGDTDVSMAARLQQDGLIRNTLVFRLLARYRHLNARIVAGTYNLSPSMTMNELVNKLASGQPDHAVSNDVTITIPPGKRVIEYPLFFTDKSGAALLPNFKADVFLQIAKTGALPSGDKLSSAYWYVRPKGDQVAYALEGYLYPDTYDFDKSADAVTVVKRLLNTLGEKLCPGPAANPDAYIHDQTQCKAHATTVKVGGKDTNIFAQMEAKFSTKDDGVALYDTLIIGSLVEREARSAGAMAGVASVFHNRYLASTGAQPGPDNGGPITMDADSTVQYAAGTPDKPWPTLQASAKTIMPDSPYNSYTNAGLPPSPICAIDSGVLTITLTAPSTTYYYYITGADHQMHYAHTLYEQQQNINQYGIG